MIRLACSECNRDDFDRITAKELRQCKKDDWTSITREQTERQFRKTYKDGKEPKGYSVLDWHTHVGVCPDCQEQE